MSTPRTREAERSRLSSLPPIFWLDMAVKAALIGLLIFAVVRDDLPQFQGKAMAGRALTYPISALIVPLIYWIVRRTGRRPAYPYGLDILLVLPFLIDTAGNALDLYDTIEWWDDANHLINWAILSTGFGLFLLRLPLGKLTTAGLIAGFGALSAIIWEFAEYFTFIRGSPEEETAYTDTLGDLALGTTGSIIAAVFVGWVLWPRRHSAAAQDSRD
jgi:hypothetical protein